MGTKFALFTERTRRTLMLAEEEARRFSHDKIGTGHLLTGIIREGGGSADVLAGLSLNAGCIAMAAYATISKGSHPANGDIPLSGRSKKVIEMAVNESSRMDHNYIGTEHLLAGIMRVGSGTAFKILDAAGVTLDSVRSEIRRLFDAYPDRNEDNAS